MFLRREAAIRRFAERQSIGLIAKRPSGLKIVLLFQILTQGEVGVFTEVDDLALYLFRLLPSGAKEQREVGIGLLGLAGFLAR